MRLRLSKAAIDRVEPPASGYRIVWDSEQRGLGLRITASGVRSWIVQRGVKGRKRRITLARFSELPVDMARRRAAELALDVAQGHELVNAARRQRLLNTTLAEALEEYLLTRPHKPKSESLLRGQMRNYLADWQHQRLTDISRSMVADRHRDIAKHSPTVANAAMRHLRAIFNFARAAYVDDDGQSLVPDNPVNRITATRGWLPESPRRRVIRPHQMPGWWAAVGELKENHRDYFRTVLLTGLRRAEALDLTWSRVDLDGGLLTITETKNGVPHVLPLSGYLQQLMERRRRVARSQYVFASRNGKPMSSPDYAVREVVEASEVPFTTHDLRRTFATVAESIDVPAYTLKRLLNHLKKGDVTADVYVQITPERMRGPMERITAEMLKQAGVAE